jgi:dipeptidyl aminopeptidase/acylaminoacyl peptidase
MPATKLLFIFLIIFLLFTAGCTSPGNGNMEGPQPTRIVSQESSTITPYSTAVNTPAAVLPAESISAENQPLATSTQTGLPLPTVTDVEFEIGEEITIEYLRNLEISGSEITFEEELPATAGYQQHIVSYISEGNKIYGLLTIPNTEMPEGGFKAIVFNHGYVPPAEYRTTERYAAYVDYLAWSGFVVFKIDYRGHGNSQGEPTGSYFSPGYTIDAINALKSLQTLDFVDPDGIGMWGHSMAGNLVLRSMLVEPDIKAGVIWAGAVYSYEDFDKYGIDDNTYQPPEQSQNQNGPAPRRRSREIFDLYGRPDEGGDYWKAVSLTENIGYLNSPIQLHHAQNDEVVSIGYTYDLVAVLQQNGKEYEFYNYPGGGHNISSPYFQQAMARTIEFFRKHL